MGHSDDTAFGVQQAHVSLHRWVTTTHLVAAQVATRFQLALKRLGLNEQSLALRTDLFKPPTLLGGQLPLF